MKYLTELEVLQEVRSKRLTRSRLSMAGRLTKSSREFWVWWPSSLLVWRWGSPLFVAPAAPAWCLCLAW